MCPSTFLALATGLKGCRPDGKGVWSLPPGGASCLVFLKGHDWPVGATVLIAETSLAGTSLGGIATGGLFMIATNPYPSVQRPCPFGDKCCPIISSVNGNRCQDSC